MSRTHLIIPDVQDYPGAPKDQLRWIGNYIRDKKPDVVVNLGDFADMSSLSSYDKGKRAMEGRRIKADLDSASEAMATLMNPLREFNCVKRRNKEAQYKPELHFLMGNHEDRLDRIGKNDAQFEGVIGLDDLKYKDYGWKVHDFLVPVCIDGVWYSHYFYRPHSGKPYSGSIETRLKHIGHSFTQGHEQGKLIGAQTLFDGTVRRGLVVGSCYLYNADYRGPQAASEWRGVIVKYEVSHGNYDIMEVSLDYLCRKYEQMKLDKFMLEKYKVRLG